MTKKSEGRLKRDALAKSMQEEGVQSPYVELENLYQSQRVMFKPYYDMARLISLPEVSMYLKDITHTTNLVRGLAADSNDLYKKMEAEYAKHAGKTAMPNAIDENENWAIIQMFQNYQMFYGVHTQTILPIMLELDEHLQFALSAKSEAEAAAVAAATAAHAADQAIAQASVTQVQQGGMTYNVDGQGNPVPHGTVYSAHPQVDANYSEPVVVAAAAPTMAAYETAAEPAVYQASEIMPRTKSA